MGVFYVFVIKKKKEKRTKKAHQPQMFLLVASKLSDAKKQAHTVSFK